MIDTRKDFGIDSKPIRVSQAVLNALEEKAEHPRERYDSILRRVLKIPPKKLKKKD